MAKRIELEGLTPQEAEAARLRATGLSQAEAYRRAFKATRAKAKTVYEKSSRLFGRPEMQARVTELLKAAKIQDIETVGETFAQMLEDMEAARRDGNHNAVMGFTRIKMQALGALKDTVAMTLEQRTSDEELIERISGGDEVTAAALRRALPADTFDA